MAPTAPPRAHGALAALPWLVTASLVVMLACYPPSAFDETLYHLPYARAFAVTGTLPFLPALRFPVFPQLDEALRAGVLLFAGDVATHEVAVASTLLTAALLRVTGGARAGTLAAATYLGNPLVVYLAGTGYVEPLLALFATAALAAATRVGDDVRWALVAGCCAGTAAATKHLGLPFALAAACVVACAASPGTRRRALLGYAAVAFIVALPTYVRLAAWTGNPLFPLLPSLFGPSPWSSFETMAGPLTRLTALPGVLVDLTLHRPVAARLPPLAPLYLAAVPLLAWAGWRDARVRRPLAVVVGYAALVPPRAHYLVPVLPFASLAVGAALARLADLPALADRVRFRRLVAPACLALLVPGWLYAAHLAVRRGPVPTDAATRARWLATALPAYAAVAFVDRTAGANAIVYGFGVENLKYYVRGTLLGEWNGPYAYATVQAAGTDPASLYGTLRSFGATHLVLSLDQPVLRLADDAATARWFARRFADAHAEVYELRSPR